MVHHKSASLPIKPQTTIALVGNPNCGKTTLFNTLTGSSQRVGNWSGVTVERKTGQCYIQERVAEIIDLPGTYTLTRFDGEGPEDENITSEFLLNGEYSFILNVVDAHCLERNLYLTLQCLEQNKPVIVALNRMDLAGNKTICVETLSAHLGCQVIPLVARSDQGIQALKSALIKPHCPLAQAKVNYPVFIENALSAVVEEYNRAQRQPPPRYQILRWLEGEKIPEGTLGIAQITSVLEQAVMVTGHTADVLIAKARYDFIE
ncbi:MAG TPA: FeoB small GTPase domain-containing protein, partial [Candidatus Berkiella sp.]|nr:FeoB small GTPase domain-containing protein [Candidatus Berkiella sp.]